MSDLVELATDQVDRVDPKATDVVTPKKPTDLGVEYGVSEVLPFTTPYKDGHSVEVLREQGEDYGPSVRQLAAMRRTDGQARALYRLVTLPIRSALKNSSFVPAEGGEAEAEFIDQLFNLPPAGGGMTTPFHRVMAEILVAVFDGFAAFELVYWQPTTGPLKGKYTLKKISKRPSETITFLADAHGGFAGLRQRTSYQGRTIDVEIPENKAFYYTCQEEERKFYGISMFQSAFYHFDKKVKLYYIAHLAAQRAAVGTRKGVMPLNASDKDKKSFVRALAELGLAQYIALPGPDWDVENLKEGGTFDFLSYINHHNSQMSKSVLAGFFDENQGGGKSDTSMVNFGEQSDAMFLLMLTSIMDEIASSINNYLIPRFIDWNFGSGLYPTFKWGTFTDEQKGAIRETFDKLAVAGQSLTATPDFVFALEKHMAEELGLELDYDQLQKEFDQKKAMQQEAADVQHEELLTYGSQGQNPNQPGQGPGGVGGRGGGPGGGGKPPAPPNTPPGVALSWPRTDAEDRLLALAGMLLEGADEEIALHGVHGKSGYALLHSPNKRIREAAEREFQAAKQRGASDEKAQAKITVSGARIASHEKAGGTHTLVSEDGTELPIRSGAGDHVSSVDEPGGGDGTSEPERTVSYLRETWSSTSSPGYTLRRFLDNTYDVVSPEGKVSNRNEDFDSDAWTEAGWHLNPGSSTRASDLAEDVEIFDDAEPEDGPGASKSKPARRP